MPFLNAREIQRDPRHWKRITRVEAFRHCWICRVAVVHSYQGCDHAAWFTRANPFFWGRGPYSYSSLRFYLYQGLYAENKATFATAASRPAPPVELEILEAFDMSGGLLSLGSPSSRTAVPKPAAPKPPTLPEAPKVPDAPAIPDVSASIPVVALPAIPEIPPLPELFPIEFQLLNGQGDPLPPTGYQLTLPDGTLKEGKSDQDGFIRVPDNAVPGETTLVLVGADKEIADAKKDEADEATPIEIQLFNSDGDAMPGQGFRITFPDGSVTEGTSDNEGFIRISDNVQTGELQLALTDAKA